MKKFLFFFFFFYCNTTTFPHPHKKKGEKSLMEEKIKPWVKTVPENFAEL